MKEERTHPLILFFNSTFGHHPDCPHYSSHLSRIGSLRVCKGCISSYLGYFSGLFLSWAFLSEPTFYLFLSVVTIFFFFLMGQKKRKTSLIKRYLQGVSLFFLVGFAFLLNNLIIRFIAFTAFSVIIIMYSKMSNHNFNCEDCTIPY